MTLRVGACQTPDILGDVAASVRVVEEFAAGADVDLLLFPECFLQGYVVTEEHVRSYAMEIVSPEFREIQAGLAGIDQMVVLGLIEREGGVYRNTAVVLHRGDVLGVYRKTHLTSGESIFTAGEEYPVFSCAGVSFGINICYDTQFRGPAAAVAEQGARVLLVPAQNMLPRDKALFWQPQHHLIRARRARETGMYVVSADVTGNRPPDRVGLGPTSVLDPGGRVITEVPAGTVGMVSAKIG